MPIFKRKQIENNCAHSWYLADYEAGSSNAGVAVEIEDYFILRCAICGAKRKVDEYEFGRLKHYGLLKEANA